MLRCPKCSRVYQDGTQRFCTLDGVRLQSDDEIIRQFERIPTGQLPRLTAPGELLSETVIMPPNDFTQTLPVKNDFTQTLPSRESVPSQIINPFVVPTNDGEQIKGEDLGTSDYSFFKTAENTSTENDANAEEAVFEFKAQRRIASSRRNLLTKPKKSKFKAVSVAAPLAAILLILAGIGFYAAYLHEGQAFDFIAAGGKALSETPPDSEPPQTETTVKNELPQRDIPVIPDKSFLRGNIINFNNARENLDGRLAEKYVGFSLSYPNDWTKNPNEGVKGASNFIDLANRVSTGVPIEQLLISWYDSKGTFEADRETFPRLAQKLHSIYPIPAYKQVSEGAAKINGLDAYQVRFEAEALDKNGETVKIWGRTIFLPVKKREARSGLLITMLATSLAPALEKVEDVGEKGELAQILQSLRLEE